MRQVVVTVPRADAELAGDALWGLGVVAIEERDLDDGRVELWTSLGDDTDRLALDLPWPWRVVEVDASVADTWRLHAVPVHVEPGLVVRPAWVPYAPAAAELVLHIEPGSTFGMGDHPTTRLCLSAVRRLVRPGSSVLDVGCGSGVLAVAACCMGAGSAHGIDIAPAAVPITTQNAIANGVTDRVTVGTETLDEIGGRYDLVVANILAPVLVALAPDLRRVLAADGHLVVSGVLESAHAHVLDALAPLRVVRTDVVDGWAAVTLRR